MNIILAETLGLHTGNGMLNSIFMVLILTICFAILWWFGDWVFRKLGVPAIVNTIWLGFFILIGVIMVINFLLGLVGHGFITY